MTAHATADVGLETPPPAAKSSHAERRSFVSDLVGLAVSCLIVVLAFSPILFGGNTLSAASNQPEGVNGTSPFPGQPPPGRAYDFRADKGASVWQFEPWAEVTHRAYANGELPLWNPYQGAGAPLAANMQSAVFDPLLLAVHLHPTPLMWDLSIIAVFVLGAAAAYVFGRVLGLSVVPAVVASAAFSLNGWFFLYSNNDFSRSYVFLPVLFLLVELVLRSRGLWAVFALGVAVAANIYMGMPEASFFVIGAAALYAAVRLVQERRRMPVHLSTVRLASGALLGFMLAAPLLLLFLQYETLSFNVHKPELGRGSDADPILGLLNWIVPFYEGAPEGSPRSWFGVTVAIAALVAVCGRTETRRRHAWFFLAMGLFLLVKIYDFGVLGWVGELPVAKLVVFPWFAPPVVGFAFAVLAGIAVQVLLVRELRLGPFLALMGAGSIALLTVALASDHSHLLRADHVKVGMRTAFFAVVAVVAIIFAARFRRPAGAWLVAGLIVAELVVLAPFDIYARRADPYVAPPWMSDVRETLQGEPYGRVLALDGKLYPNTASAFALQDIRALDALYVARYFRFVRTFVQPIRDRFTGTEPPAVALRNNPLLDALGVRVVVSQRDLSHVPGMRPVGRDADTRVYAKTNPFPRAWVVHDVHVVLGEDEAFAFLQKRSRRQGDVYVVDRFDPRREAVVEGVANSSNDDLRAIDSGGEACRPGERDRATILSYSGGSMSLRVWAACPGLLVLPDTYFPGWKATVDGRDAAIHATNGAFRGVIVPAGTSRVEFGYHPRAFSIGVLLALAGVLGVIVIWLIIWSTSRRRRPEGLSA